MFCLKINNRGKLIWLSTDEINVLESMTLSKADEDFEIKDDRESCLATEYKAMYGVMLVNSTATSEDLNMYFSGDNPKEIGVLSDLICLVFPLHEISIHSEKLCEDGKRIVFKALVSPSSELANIPNYPFLEGDKQLLTGFFRDESRGKKPTKNIFDRDGVLIFSLYDWDGTYSDTALEETMTTINKHQL